MKIKNIIFDLGGVILNINYQLTIEAFKKLGIHDFDSLYSQFKQSDLFDNLETGKISGDEFIAKIQKVKSISDIEITNAWNAMILNLPKNRVDMLIRLSKDFNIFLLSNTNEIHYECYINQLNELKYVKDFNSLFKATYYSHEIGLRKPNSDIYEFVLTNSNLKASESLFIDDLENNILGAKSVGLKTFNHTKGDISYIIDELVYSS